MVLNTFKNKTALLVINSTEQTNNMKKVMPRVRIELTAFRLWDWRAAYCATKAWWWRSANIEKIIFSFFFISDVFMLKKVDRNLQLAPLTIHAEKRWYLKTQSAPQPYVSFGVPPKQWIECSWCYEVLF